MNDIVRFQVEDKIITGSDILNAIDNVLEHVRETGDLSVAENALKSLMGIEKVSGVAIAKLLSGLHKWWDDTNQDTLTNDTFDDWIYSVSDQFNSTYIDRCISIYQKQESGTFSERIMSRPIKDQQAIAGHLDQDYTLNKAQWRELERATSNAEVLAILREAKGKQPRKSALLLVLERDGSINGYKEGKKYFVGYLNLKEAATEETIEKAINRIVKNTGIQIK